MDLVIDSLDYRGVHLDFFQDAPSRQVYINYQGNQVFFGINNSLYSDDAKKLIDFDLDYICSFKKANALLKYFDNSGSRDIVLLQKRRILKVYLVSPSLNLDEVKRDAEAVAMYELEPPKTLSVSIIKKF